MRQTGHLGLLVREGEAHGAVGALLPLYDRVLHTLQPQPPTIYAEHEQLYQSLALLLTPHQVANPGKGDALQ
jgi:hypothetical protein